MKTPNKISSITTLKPYSLNKYKRRLYRKRKHYQKAFGRGQGTRLFELFYDYSRKALPPRWEVSVKNTKGKIYLRPNTSDTATFEQVFVAKEYEVPFDFSPETIIDGGANVGFATLFFANKYPQAQILAIEPDRSNMEVLCLNTEPYENVKKIQSAIWGHTTHLRIENPEVEKWAFKVIESEAGQPDSFQAYSIEQLIAKMGRESIDLLKLDIEGSEISVFGGGYERWLPKVKMLMIELHEKISPGCTKVLEEALSKYSFEKMENGENLIYYQKEFMKGKKHKKKPRN